MTPAPRQRASKGACVLCDDSRPHNATVSQATVCWRCWYEILEQAARDQSERVAGLEDKAAELELREHRATHAERRGR